jgi:hypothetical protein
MLAPYQFAETAVTAAGALMPGTSVTELAPPPPQAVSVNVDKQINRNLFMVTLLVEAKHISIR